MTKNGEWPMVWTLDLRTFIMPNDISRKPNYKRTHKDITYTISEKCELGAEYLNNNNYNFLTTVIFLL